MFEKLKGVPPMPWQAQWFDVIGEMIRDDETGIWVPAYPEAFDTLMRQQGKTGIAEGWMWDRLLLWEPWDGKPQSVAYTAQSGADGRKKYVKDMLPTWKRSPLWKHAGKVRLAAEDPGLNFKNDANLSLLSTTQSAGHGLVIDAAFLDEIFDDKDDRREQTLVPAMATRHDRQKLVSSAAGDQTSTLFLRKQEAGRQAVEEDRREGMAYLEYSADKNAPGYDPESPEVWRECMPALGITISERTVRQAFQEMTSDPEKGVAEFERAWLNIPKTSGREVIVPDALWRAACSPDYQPSGPITFGVDAHPSLDSAWVVASGGGASELIEPPASGTSWLLGWLVSRCQSHGAQVALDSQGPVGWLVPELKAERVRVVEYSADMMKEACMWWWQELGNGKLRQRTSAHLDAAVKHAARRFYQDRWLWVRGLDPDTSPLVAQTLAAHASAMAPVSDPLNNIW